MAAPAYLEMKRQSVIAALAEPDKLSPTSPYYIGSFSFFPVDGDDSRDQGFYFVVAPALRKLEKRGELKETSRFRVTLIGLPRTGPAPGGQDDPIAIREVRFLDVPDRTKP